MCGVGLATVALGLGASLPALAADGAEAPPGFIAGERVNAAWDKLRFAGTQSADAYPLPGGIALPLDPPAVLETPGTFTQDGALEMVAAFYYVCAWEDQLAKTIRSGEDEAAEAARDHLRALASLPDVGRLVQDLPSWESAIAARLTDPDALEADVAACTYYREGSAK